VPWIPPEPDDPFEPDEFEVVEVTLYVDGVLDLRPGRTSIANLSRGLGGPRKQDTE
jgi:hypothetical protein